jgi:hypothetical protein
MALSPVENMTYHPVRKTHHDAKHGRAERNGITLMRMALQEQRGNGTAH